MKITEIRMFLCDDTKLKATLSLTLEDQFVIKGIKVIEGRQGLFLAMPSRRKEDGTYEDICHPVNKETRDYFEQTVLEHYKERREGRGSGNRRPSEDDHSSPAPPA
ncbi:MAG: SpoVG family protein [Candidatus Eisenbacteria bacterium]|uniref:SpoVG family protein n=1 Tax=Eiseniibacteriota bacterium TaxID=2212470 RepID=A0A956LY05_UNCEI|nr:SpoVG family protein [Candidatus Eisenbacteria bacterium]